LGGVADIQSAWRLGCSTQAIGSSAWRRPWHKLRNLFSLRCLKEEPTTEITMIEFTNVVAAVTSAIVIRLIDAFLTRRDRPVIETKAIKK
jgi:hypothetical protein